MLIQLLIATARAGGDAVAPWPSLAAGFILVTSFVIIGIAVSQFARDDYDDSEGCDDKN